MCINNFRVVYALVLLTIVMTSPSAEQRARCGAESQFIKTKSMGKNFSCLSNQNIEPEIVIQIRNSRSRGPVLSLVKLATMPTPQLSRIIFNTLLSCSGPDSSAGIANGYWLDGPGIESRGVRFSAPVQTGPGAHPASFTNGTGSFLGVKSGWGVTLTPHTF